MDNKHPEVIEVELGGKKRTLKLGPAAFRIAKIKHGVGFSLADLSSPSLDVLAQLVWIALLPDTPDQDEIEVMQWLSAAGEAGVLKRTFASLARLTDGMEEIAGGNVKGQKRKTR